MARNSRPARTVIFCFSLSEIQFGGDNKRSGQSLRATRCHSGAREARTSGVQLHLGESRDSGFDAAHRPGMTDEKSHHYGPRFSTLTPNPLCYPTGKSRTISVESSVRKYTSSRLPQINRKTPPSCPTRGAYPDRQKRGAGCGGRDDAKDERIVAHGEIVWVRRPGAGVNS